MMLHTPHSGRAIAVVLVATLAVFAVTACSGRSGDWPDRPGPKVVVSFAPIYCFTANVAGQDAVVRNMMTTTGPHSFNPTDVEARLLRRADIFFVNGLGLDEGVADSLKRGSGNRTLKIVELAGRLPTEQLLAGLKHEGHDHGPHDPHVWLDPELAAVMAEGIRDELKSSDHEHAADYDRRTAEYADRLRALRAEGRKLLEGKAERRMVTFHESLGYFARAFDLTVAGVVQKKPGVEPDKAALEEVIAVCKMQGVRLIAVEPQYGTASADTILRELERAGIKGAALVVIDPLETCRPDELDAGWYERKMRANLEALDKAIK
jgi:ABC-type Zn uptake system ZnuABC Zn-binding protein ZnuA